MSFSRAPVARFNEPHRKAPGNGKATSPPPEEKTAKSQAGSTHSCKSPGSGKAHSPPPPKEKASKSQSVPAPTRCRTITPPFTQGRTRSTSANSSCRTRALRKSNTSLSSVSKMVQPEGAEIVENVQQEETDAEQLTEKSPSDEPMSQVASEPTAPLITPLTPAATATKSASKVASEASDVVAGSPSSTPSPRKSTRMSQDRQNRRVLESQFLTKRKRFLALRKELLDKQKCVMDLYSSMAELRERVIDSGGRDLGSLEEVKIIDLGQLTGITAVHTRGGKKRQEGAGEDLNTDNQLAKAIQGQPREPQTWFEGKLHEIPTNWTMLCRHALEKRGRVLSWLQQLPKDEETLLLKPEELTSQLEEFQKDGENFDRLLEEAQQGHAELVSQLLAAINKLSEEENRKETEAGLAHQVQLEASHQHEMHELQARLQQTMDDFVAEQAKNQELTEKMAELDAQLKMSRQRMRETEAKLCTDESRIQQLNSQVRAIEEQLHLKEASLDHKTKATSEVVNRLERQREHLETKVKNMTKVMNQKEEEANVFICNLQSRLQDAATTLEEAVQLRKKLQHQVDESLKRYTELEEKYKKLCETKTEANNSKEAELNHAKKEVALKSEHAKKEAEHAKKEAEHVKKEAEHAKKEAEHAKKEAEHAKKEAEHAKKEAALKMELQAIKVQLQTSKGQLTALEEEKTHLMDSVKQLKKEEDKIAHKVVVEIKQKDEKIHHLSEQVKELLSTQEMNNDHLAKYEKQVNDMRAHMATMTSEGSSQRQVQFADLQQQVADLQATLSEVVRHNEELEQTLVQKQLEVEQRERVMREQGKVLKVRDELICLLKGKEQRQDDQVTQLQTTLQERESNADKVNMEVTAKAEELQGLYNTLEAKQAQVMRLEKLVKQLEEQQDRSQAQRTRHEARIAQLEHVLQSQNSTQRYAAGGGEGRVGDQHYRTGGNTDRQVGLCGINGGTVGHKKLVHKSFPNQRKTFVDKTTGNHRRRDIEQRMLGSNVAGSKTFLVKGENQAGWPYHHQTKKICMENNYNDSSIGKCSQHILKYDEKTYSGKSKVYVGIKASKRQLGMIDNIICFMKGKRDCQTKEHLLHARKNSSVQLNCHNEDNPTRCSGDETRKKIHNSSTRQVANKTTYQYADCGLQYTENLYSADKYISSKNSITSHRNKVKGESRVKTNTFRENDQRNTYSQDYLPNFNNGEDNQLSKAVPNRDDYQNSVNTNHRNKKIHKLNKSTQVKDRRQEFMNDNQANGYIGSQHESNWDCYYKDNTADEERSKHIVHNWEYHGSSNDNLAQWEYSSSKNDVRPHLDNRDTYRDRSEGYLIPKQTEISQEDNSWSVRQVCDHQLLKQGNTQNKMHMNMNEKQIQRNREARVSGNRIESVPEITDEQPVHNKVNMHTNLNNSEDCAMKLQHQNNSDKLHMGKYQSAGDLIHFTPYNINLNNSEDCAVKLQHQNNSEKTFMDRFQNVENLFNFAPYDINTPENLSNSKNCAVKLPHQTNSEKLYMDKGQHAVNLINFTPYNTDINTTDTFGTESNLKNNFDSVLWRPQTGQDHQEVFHENTSVLCMHTTSSSDNSVEPFCEETVVTKVEINKTREQENILVCGSCGSIYQHENGGEMKTFVTDYVNMNSKDSSLCQMCSNHSGSIKCQNNKNEKYKTCIRKDDYNLMTDQKSSMTNSENGPAKKIHLNMIISSIETKPDVSENYALRFQSRYCKSNDRINNSEEHKTNGARYTESQHCGHGEVSDKHSAILHGHARLTPMSDEVIQQYPLSIHYFSDGAPTHSPMGSTHYCIIPVCSNIGTQVDNLLEHPSLHSMNQFALPMLPLSTQPAQNALYCPVNESHYLPCITNEY